METKSIQVDLNNKATTNVTTKKTKIIEPKIREKRVITTTNKWMIQEPDIQLQYIQQIFDKIPETEYDKSIKSLLIQQITQKISGYRSQDIDKHLFSENDFVNLDYVIELMTKCQNNCFYCKKRTHVLYEFVREPNQWTLERIDNKFGHNKDNVVIACLNCNLRRRTMYHERYVFTKQLNIIKNEHI
jgi:hypothetical protein